MGSAATASGLLFLGVCMVVAAFIVVSVRAYQIQPDLIRKIFRYTTVVAIWIGVSVASVIVGFRIEKRHSDFYSRGFKSVSEIWGGSVSQAPPEFGEYVLTTNEYVNEKTGKTEERTRYVIKDLGFSEQNVKAKISSNIRTKGLLKFPGFNLIFHGRYVVKNTRNSPAEVVFRFDLPKNAGNISDVSVMRNGSTYTEDANFADGIEWQSVMQKGEEAVFEIKYKAQGTGSFYYLMNTKKLEIRKMNFDVETDFTDISIPDSAMVPTSNVSESGKSKILWSGENLVTGQNIALTFEIPGNYGKVASKLFFYGPLSLGLFTAILLIFTLASGKPLYPMNYFFLLGGFFIFYLLTSYVLSFWNVFLSIGAGLILSTSITIYYAYLIKRDLNLVKAVAVSLFIFQWIFSFAFFLPEYTGLIITLAGIASFVAIMRYTAEVDWNDKF